MTVQHPFFNFIRDDWKVFLAVVKFESMSLAAISLGYQQSSVSKAIANLESEEKTKLFFRNRRGVNLTPKGQEFAKFLWSILETATPRAVIDFQPPLVVALHPCIAMSLTDKILSIASQCKVSSSLKIKLESSRLAVEDIVARKVDFAIAAAPRRQGDLVICPLTQDSVGLFQSARALSQNDKRVLLWNSDMIGANNMLRAFKSAEKIEISDYEVIASTAKKFPRAMALLPSLIAKRYHLERVGKVLMRSNISLVYRADSQWTAAGKKFRDQLRELKFDDC